MVIYKACQYLKQTLSTCPWASNLLENLYEKGSFFLLSQTL